MSDKDLTQLLEAFYHGTISEQDEQLLKEFFLHSGTVPARWETEQKCFKALYPSEESILPEGLSERLEKRIEEIATKEKKITLHRLFYRITTVAATILFCIGLWYGTQKETYPTLADTFTDPVEAAIAAEQILIFMSAQLNEGLNQVAEGAEDIVTIKRTVYQHLKD